jgi:hypothetical protein
MWESKLELPMELAKSISEILGLYQQSSSGQLFAATCFETDMVSILKQMPDPYSLLWSEIFV